MHFAGNKHEFFAKTKFAGCLREDEHDELFKCCTWRTVSVGETIFLQGDTTDSGLVMVVDGALGVYGSLEEDSMPTKTQTNSPTLIKSASVESLEGGWKKGMEEVGATEWMHYQLTAGESIGDIDLLYASKRRRFTVKAIKHSTVLELSQEVCQRQ